jgi:invasion protein IalB
LAAASLVLLAGYGLGLGQTQPKAKTAAPAATTEVPLRTQNPAQQTENAAPPPWSSRCTSEGRQAVLDCSVEQSVFESQSRQLLLMVAVRVSSDTRKPSIVLQLPFGLFLPAGVSVQFDENKPERLEVQTCDQKGCYVTMPMSSEMLQSMTKGKNMSVKFQNLSKKEIALPVQLAGFAAAYQKIQ